MVASNGGATLASRDRTKRPTLNPPGSLQFRNHEARQAEEENHCQACDQFPDFLCSRDHRAIGGPEEPHVHVAHEDHQRQDPTQTVQALQVMIHLRHLGLCVAHGSSALAVKQPKLRQMTRTLP